MTRLRSRLRWGLLFGALAVAAGCGDSQEAKNSKTALTASSSAGYQATLEDGIDFRRDGFPAFITQVDGLSDREAFGRWSDARLAPAVRFVFRDPLPRKFEVALTAWVIDQNEKLPVVVRAGGVEQSISFEKPRSQQTQVLAFDLPSNTNILEVVAPKPVVAKTLDPKSLDERRLSIAFVSLKIRKL
jgi:phosphoglycerol transferase